jgi:TetR/AcrR family fatty acid metabolism transcriptional regulator
MDDPVQQQLIAARRDQILDAATTVFARKGFHPTTIKDIAREAGIADGTIYNYFANKSALLIGIFDRMRAIAQADDTLVDLHQADLRTFLVTLLRQPFAALADDDFALFRIIVAEMMVNDELRALYNEQLLQPTVQLAEAYLTEWAATRGVELADIGLTTRAITALVFGTLMQRVIGDDLSTDHWAAMPDFLTDLLLNGLEPDE